MWVATCMHIELDVKSLILRKDECANLQHLVVSTGNIWGSVTFDKVFWTSGVPQGTVLAPLLFCFVIILYP